MADLTESHLQRNELFILYIATKQSNSNETERNEAPAKKGKREGGKMNKKKQKRRIRNDTSDHHQSLPNINQPQCCWYLTAPTVPPLPAAAVSLSVRTAVWWTWTGGVGWSTDILMGAPTGRGGNNNKYLPYFSPIARGHGR